MMTTTIPALTSRRIVPTSMASARAGVAAVSNRATTSTSAIIR
jgi:hypothetical protein